MTIEREEAIKTLQHCGAENFCPHCISTTNCYGCNMRDALDMAIEALKEQTTPTIKLNNQIHLCDSCKYNYPNCPSENEDVLFGNGVGNDNICCCAKYFVSADRPIKAIQDCRNCKYGKYNERYSEYFCYHNGECVNYDLWESGEELADRPHGEWIKHEIEDTCRWVECSECHKEYPNIEMNFCPNCGKDMRGNKKKEENNDVHKVPLYVYASWDRSEE